MAMQSNDPTTCSRRFGTGTCKQDAQYMVNGEPRCPDHTPAASAEVDVMPLHTPEPLPPCGCGCGQSVLRKKSTYRQGHDARHRGILIRRVREIADAEAAQLLIAKGWRTQTEADAELERAIARTGMVVNAEAGDEAERAETTAEQAACDEGQSA